MAGSFYDRIPGYHAAVAAETTGRDAAYLRPPRRVAGLVLRPLTLRDYLRLSAEKSPFVCGGRSGKDGACFLLWHQCADPADQIEPPAFAARFDTVDADVLMASCGEFVDAFMVDAPRGSGNGKGAYYGVGAMLISAFRMAYPGATRAEVLDTPLDELWQEWKAIQQARNPNVVLFNRSDRLKGDYALQLQREAETAGAIIKKRPPSTRKKAKKYGQ